MGCSWFGFGDKQVFAGSFDSKGKMDCFPSAKHWTMCESMKLIYDAKKKPPYQYSWGDSIPIQVKLVEQPTTASSN